MASLIEEARTKGRSNSLGSDTSEVSVDSNDVRPTHTRSARDQPQ